MPIHVVRPGDTLSGIAQRFGSSVQAIAQANGIPDPDRIQAGRTLCVPNGPEVPPRLRAYTVKSGDTLGRIAQSFGTTVRAIAQENGISNPDLIFAGQTLCVPVGAGADDLPLKNGPASHEVQGNVLAAFNKDHQVFLLLNFTDAQGARQWLKTVEPLVATTNQVETFNEQFSAARRARGGDDPENLKAVWVNVGLTVDGLRALSSNFENLDADLRNLSGPWQGFEAFREKPRDEARAQSLGDVDDSAPDKWVFGGPGQPEVDAVATVAADDPADLEDRLRKLGRAAARNGVLTVLRLDGETLPGSRKGNEHFGFKDGISQPGVRDFHPPDPQNPKHRKGHPGEKLIAPGEFVLGYEDEHGRDVGSVPGWMVNGSFQVLRRLSQDVPGWWAQMRQAQEHGIEGGEDRLAAKVVGRWRSGTPLAHAPDRDDRSGRVRRNDNDFTYDDPEGEKTPRFSHIRKTYPRDATFRDDAHRMMRRGIPFGQPFDSAMGRGRGQDAERGLIFNMHCADIAEQFEFVQQVWSNNAGFQQPGDGPDPVIGTDGPVTLHEKGNTKQLDFRRFVHTTGALYAFAPSKSILQRLANGEL